MSGLARWMMRLYPARWRARYGDELDALLTDTGADVRIVSDLFRGGMRMQMKTWPFFKLAFALGLVGLLLGTGLAWLLPSQYMSIATLQIQPSHISESSSDDILPSLNERIQQLQTMALSRTELYRIILNLGLYRDELASRPAEDAIEMMRTNIRLDFVALPGKAGKRAAAFNIRFTYPDRFKAQQTVAALVNAVERINQREQAEGTTGGPALLIVDAPSLPQNPVWPNSSTLLLAAFLAAIAVAGLWRLAHPVGIIRRRFAVTSLAMGVSALVLMAASINLQLWTNWYVSTGTLKLSNGGGEEIAAIKNDILSRTSLSQIVNNPRLRLYAEQTRTTPLEDVIQSMQQHITIRRITGYAGTYVTISFEYYDRYKAREVVSELMSRFAKAGMQLHASPAPSKRAGMVLDVLDNPNLPLAPTKPNRYLIAGAGSIVGIFVAAIISLLRRRWKPEPEFPLNIVNE